MPHLPVHYLKATELFLGHFPSFVLQELHGLLAPFQRKTLVLVFGALHILVPGMMFMTILTEILLMMVLFVQNPSYKVKRSPRKVHILRGTSLAAHQSVSYVPFLLTKGNTFF